MKNNYKFKTEEMTELWEGWENEFNGGDYETKKVEYFESNGNYEFVVYSDNFKLTFIIKEPFKVPLEDFNDRNKKSSKQLLKKFDDYDCIYNLVKKEPK